MNDNLRNRAIKISSLESLQSMLNSLCLEINNRLSNDKEFESRIKNGIMSELNEIKKTLDIIDK